MKLTLVSWRKPYVSAHARTLVHIDTPTLSDEYGRTGCGKRYPRDHAETFETREDDVSELQCRSCLRALRSE